MKLRLFCLLACFYMLLASKAEPWADSKVMYETAKAVIDRHTIELTIPGADFFFVIRDGKRYAINAPGNIVALMPGYLLFKKLSRVHGAPAQLLYGLTSHVPSALIMAGVAALFFAVARREGASQRAALYLSLLLGLGTIVFVYARVPYSEALQTLALLWLYERAVVLGERLDFRSAFWAGVCCGVLLSAKAVLVLAMPIALAYVVVKKRHEARKLAISLGIASLPFAAFVVLNMAYNHARTGSWLNAGYGSAEHVFSGSATQALYGLLLAPGCAFWIYSPPLLLGLLALPMFLRRDSAKGLMLVGIWLSVLLPLLRYHSWHGLWCWGPRYLVPLTPLILLPVAPFIGAALRGSLAILWKLALLVLSICGVAVQLIGIALHWDLYIAIAGHATGLSELAILFIPRLAPIRGHLWLLRHDLSHGKNWLLDAPWAPSPPHADIAGFWPRVGIDLWFLEWKQVHAPKPWLYGIAALLLIGITWAAVGLALHREPRRRES